MDTAILRKSSTHTNLRSSAPLNSHALAIFYDSRPWQRVFIVTIITERIKNQEAGYTPAQSFSFLSATPEERYELRLLVADYFIQRGRISRGEWRELVEEAAAAYADDLG